MSTKTTTRRSPSAAVEREVVFTLILALGALSLAIFVSWLVHGNPASDAIAKTATDAPTQQTAHAK